MLKTGRPDAMILDANVLIAALDAHDSHHSNAVDILSGSADEPLHCPDLTLAEALVAHARAGRYERARAYLDELGVKVYPLNECAEELSYLRATSRLKMPDCVVVLAAQRSGEAVATFDGALAKAAMGRGLTVVGPVR